MSVLRPEFLWILTLAIPIIAAHLYRIRRRKHLVPYLRFWEDIQGQDRLRSLITRLKDLFLLLLNLLILGLVTLVVADVRIRGLSPEAKEFIVLLDDTPSMAAEDRMSRAREEARHFRKKYLIQNDRAVWMTFGGRILDEDLTYPIQFAASPSPSEFHSRLAALYPNHRMVYITDGEEALPDAARIVVGREASNVSLSRPVWESDILSIQIRNHSAKPIQGTLKVNGRAHSVSLQGGETTRWSGKPELEKGEDLVRAQWEPTDAFSLDQRVYSIRPRRDSAPVIVFSQVPLSPFLYHALDLLATHGILSREQVADRPDRFGPLRETIQDRYWILFNACAPKDPVRRGRVLYLGAPSDALPVKVTRVADHPQVLKIWEGLGVQSGSFTVRRSQVFAREEGLIPLVESPVGPIAVAGKKGGLTFVILGFTLDESDLQLTPVFPLLMRGVAEWSREARLFPASAQSGEEITNQFPIPDPEVRLHYENGTVRGWTGTVRDGLLSVPLQAPGFYAVMGETFEEVIGVNMGDSESDLTPHLATDLKDIREPGWWERIPLSALAAVLALFLCLIEWGLAVKKP
jgi:hypothetical protein